jgi:predicted ATPase/class 3 adenylate cyclase
MSRQPAGTTTFLFTDIEGSTRLLQSLGDTGYARVLIDYRRLIRTAFQLGGGTEIGDQGDGLLVIFPRARDAVAAAVAAQLAIIKHAWPDGAIPRVRMGIHTGEPYTMAGKLIGLDVHRAARICGAGHGGQILVSATTTALVEGALPARTDVHSLGSHRLRDLQQRERIFQVLHPDLPRDFPPLRSLDAFPNNLPRQLTNFVGRERERAEVKRLLTTTSILMLTGSSGCGKTRLALEIAADLVEAYADGVWFVELAALTEPGLVVNTIVSAFGMRKAQGLTLEETLLEYLRPRELLLVLDNCEHLLMECAGLMETLIRSCPRLHVLATSREPFGITGETVWRVPSLTLPVSDETSSVEGLMLYEATRLFVDRATAIQPAFKPRSEDAAAVTAICRRLDGIPLAIELAAARMRALSAEQIAERLDARFRLLTGGSRTALPRHQTLRGALDWSHDLLSHNERALLRRLAVFAGSWTLEAAEVICAGDGLERPDILDLLTQLVLKSLVLLDARGERVRYRLLETVRQYARDRLEQSGETRSLLIQHLNWYLALVESRVEPLSGSDQSRWLDWLEEERENLRAALETSKMQESAGNEGLRLARALWQFWSLRGDFSEGRRWLETMLAHCRTAPASIRAHALVGTAFLAHRQSDYEGTIRLCNESLALFRDLGDLPGMGRSLYLLGVVAEYQGDYGRAKRLLEESLSLGRQAGEKRRIALSLNSIGEVARCQGDYMAALASYEESLAVAQEIGDERAVTGPLGNLGHVALYQGDGERAARLFREALIVGRRLGHKVAIAQYLAGLGGVAVLEGRHARAARLLGAARSLLSVVGASLSPPDEIEYKRSIDAARVELSTALFEEALGEGRAMALEEAIDYALEEVPTIVAPE